MRYALPLSLLLLSIASPLFAQQEPPLATDSAEWVTLQIDRPFFEVAEPVTATVTNRIAEGDVYLDSFTLDRGGVRIQKLEGLDARKKLMAGDRSSQTLTWNGVSGKSEEFFAPGTYRITVGGRRVIPVRPSEMFYRHMLLLSTQPETHAFTLSVEFEIVSRRPEKLVVRTTKSAFERNEQVCIFVINRTRSTQTGSLFIDRFLVDPRMRPFPYHLPSLLGIPIGPNDGRRMFTWVAPQSGRHRLTGVFRSRRIEWNFRVR